MTSSAANTRYTV